MNDTQVYTWKVLCSSCIYQTVQKKKKKDAVFTGVSSQHINTTINLQSIFILFFFIIPTLFKWNSLPDTVFVAMAHSIRKGKARVAQRVSLYVAQTACYTWRSGTSLLKDSVFT